MRIALMGGAGRMGRALMESLTTACDCVLAGAVDHKSGVMLGISGAPEGIPITDDLDSVLLSCDVLVDFSRPEGTSLAVDGCRKLRKPLVVGTTGFTTGQIALIEAASKYIPICMAANFSIGLNVCLELLGRATQMLGPAYDVEILEAHHRRKVDAPSGTALRMGRAVAAARGQRLDECAVYAREGTTGARRDGEIGFSTVRGGDIVGDHTVMFLGEGERIEVSHKASSRDNFARGALRAAVWLKDQPAGLYEMRDVLGLR